MTSTSSPIGGRCDGPKGTKMRSFMKTGLAALASLALGGVPAAHMASARESLLSMYRGERDAGVRKALLQSIAQLGFTGAVPELRALRGVDPSLAPEIDTWIRVLELGLQEWNLILREKQRLQQVR